MKLAKKIMSSIIMVVLFVIIILCIIQLCILYGNLKGSTATNLYGAVTIGLIGVLGLGGIFLVILQTSVLFVALLLEYKNMLKNQDTINRNWFLILVAGVSFIYETGFFIFAFSWEFLAFIIVHLLIIVYGIISIIDQKNS